MKPTFHTIFEYIIGNVSYVGGGFSFYLTLAIYIDITKSIIASFMLLKAKIIVLDHEIKANGFKRSIKECVDFHVEIFEYIVGLEDTMHYIFLTQFLITSVTLCGVFYHIMVII